jgi:MOSC domain-containing protein YiiM
MCEKEKKGQDNGKGRVTGLFSHPQKSYKKSEPTSEMVAVKSMVLITGRGMEGSRFLDKSCHVTGLETEEIDKYSKLIGQRILPGQCRSNIETSSIPMTQLFVENGNEALYVQIGVSVILKVYAQRTPCWKMNRICEGLEDLMWGRVAIVNG